MIPGIDVSVYQGQINWSKVAASGIRFAWVRHSDGLRRLDPRWETNLQGAKSAGIAVGTYQYFRPSQGGFAQAMAMCDEMVAVGTGGLGDLATALDLEDDCGLATVDLMRETLIWLDTVEQRMGRLPIVYVGPWFAKTHGLETLSHLARRPLWVSHYTRAAKPWVPKPWLTWDAWQWSGSGTCDGIKGAVDLDRIANEATLASLRFE